MIHKKMLIDGVWTSGNGNDLLEVVNPATEEVFAHVPKATKEDVQDAVNAADKSYKSWSKLSPFRRAKS